MSHRPLFTVHSVSKALPPAPQKARPVRVLSQHRRVINLEDEEGNLFAVVTPEIGNGPFHLVLSEPADFDAMRIGAAGVWREQSLTLDGVQIDWSRARSWDPRLKPITIAPRVFSMLDECASVDESIRERWIGMDQLTIARLQMGAALITKGVLRNDMKAIRKGVSMLAGLGPGLTPAGDDYLLGALARLQLDATLPDVSILGQFMPTAGLITTRLSRAWLDYAARGMFDARWHTLRLALLQRNQQVVCKAARGIIRVGASSGPQAMAGFLLIQ